MSILVACGGAGRGGFQGPGYDASNGSDDGSQVQTLGPDGAPSNPDDSGSSSGTGSASTSSSGSSSGGSASGSSGGTTGSSASSSGAKSSSASSSGSSGGASSSSSSSGSSSGSSASSSSGGTSSGLCTYGTQTNGTGSFTWYYFGQGTSQQNGYYLTACGYQGTESGMIDTVQNIANTSPASDTYFAAIPGISGFSTVNDCGACIEITNGGTSIVATVIDECPTDNGENSACALSNGQPNPAHLDLSYGAWQALNYSSGDPTGTTWKFVSCPVTGNITTRLKSGNADQVYIENTTLPIVSLTYNGQAGTHLSYGAWQLPGGANAAGATVTLTDVEGHMVTVTIPGGGGSTSQQFPDRCP
ncbi:MAG: hypothetical protein ACLP1X_13960 [Polyangiaceae bacterium]